MITTPEQMREAAALVESTENHPMSLHTWQSWIDDLPLPDSFDDGKAALQEYMQYLAFPIAPQPVAVTVKPLVDYILQDDQHNRLIPRIVDIAYLAWSKGRSGKNNDDGGPCDWVNDTKPLVDRNINKIRAALMIQPADPLSDPRVVALVEAAQALGAMPEGYCFCSKDRIGDDSKIHEPECRDLRAALRAIGGEA